MKKNCFIGMHFKLLFYEMFSMYLNRQNSQFSLNIAAVSCSSNGYRLGGVKMVSGTTGKLGRAWHFWLGQLSRAWCMASVYGGARGVVHGWCARWGLGKSMCILPGLKTTNFHSV